MMYLSPFPAIIAPELFALLSLESGLLYAFALFITTMVTSAPGMVHMTTDRPFNIPTTFLVTPPGHVDVFMFGQGVLYPLCGLLAVSGLGRIMRPVLRL
jgi:hypothetical protein